MRRAAITHRNGELEACEQGDLWTVRVGRRVARSRYLDLALAAILGDAREAHRLAARLVADLVDGVEEPEAPVPQRERGPRAGHELSAKSLLLVLRVVVLAVVVSTAFMVTTWLSALR